MVGGNRSTYYTVRAMNAVLDRKDEGIAETDLDDI
jgi:hypothetical protein